MSGHEKPPRIELELQPHGCVDCAPTHGDQGIDADELEIDNLRRQLRQAIAERDGARSEAAAAKRERDLARQALEGGRRAQMALLDRIAEHLGLSCGLELAENPALAKRSAQ